jgi:hypothetical protein
MNTDDLYGFQYDPYRDCACGDCAEFDEPMYGGQGTGSCEVFNAALASLPQDFGEIELPAATSKCKRFRPSDSLLRDMEEAAAYRRQTQIVRDTKGFE